MGTRIESRPVVRRITRDQAVVIVGIPLRLHQPLLSALGAPDVVRVARRPTVEGRGYRLGIHRRDMKRPVSEILDQIRSAERHDASKRSPAVCPVSVLAVA